MALVYTQKADQDVKYQNINPVQSPEQKVKEGEVVAMLYRLRAEMENLHVDLSSLNKRLAPVLREPWPRPEEESTCSNISAPLALELESLVGAVNYARDMINQIDARLEL